MIRCLRRRLTVILAGCLDSLEEEGAKQTSAVRTTATSSKPESKAAAESCPVTRPNGNVPPGETVSRDHAISATTLFGLTSIPTRSAHGRGHPQGREHRDQGPLVARRFGAVTIVGRRLDASAPPASAWIPSGYGRKDFQSTAITFPTSGCWEVTGSVETQVSRYQPHR